MGYTLIIGEAEMQYDKDDLWLRLSAELANAEDAPAFGEPTDHENQRWPSYTGWTEFSRESGLEPLFFGGGWDREMRCYRDCPEGYHRDRPLIDSHPGVAPICQGDLDVIKSAISKRREKTGEKPPGFSDDDSLDHVLARLIWLEYWFEWALRTCKIPVFANS